MTDNNKEVKKDKKNIKEKDEKKSSNKELKQKEDQSTAAWADVKCKTKDAKVSVPSEEAVEDAQDWINENKL